ncbi:hypothetical protein GOP47_0029807 [Adiantum capillus-veneris]|nr:hypothetical protein GOP47_0029807 [Adiantum capillus-veneris]
MLYKLPSDFNVTCGQHTTIGSAQVSNDSTRFTPILVSKESRFAWGLLASNSDESLNSHTCSLSVVCYSCKAYYLAWSACCNDQGQIFSSGDILKLGEHRDLQLLDSGGLVIWSSNAMHVDSIELLETGNLLLLGTQNTIIWQSFNYPSNILLPGQTLTPGMRLTAGNYYASMEPGGLALYVKVLQTPLPYLVLNSTWGLSDIQAITESACHGLTLVYAADGSSLMMEMNMGSHGSPCYNSSARNTITRFNRTVSTNLNGFKYLSLSYNGGLQTYANDKVEFSWFNQGDDNEGRGYCNLPGHCGDFGICDPGGQCRCPHSLVNGTLDYMAATDYSVEEPEIDDCPQIQAANCSVIGASYKVLKLQDLDYFAHRYIPSTGKYFSMETCVDSCMKNCSCLIAFYNNLSLDCHHYSTALSMQRTTYGGNYVVFIKMLLPSDNTENQLQPPTSFPNHRLNFIAIAIIFGVSLIVCLTVFLWVYKHYGSWNDGNNAQEGRVQRTEDDVFLGSLSGLPPRYTFKEMQQITNGFTVRLGQGSFGCVYGGTLNDGSKIAVKRLEGTRQGNKEFRAEVASLAGISHVNLVRLRGFCAEQAQRMLIYEFMTNGSLDRWLARGEDEGGGSAYGAGAGLDWRQRLKIAADAARGLAYLHGESRERIFHLDIKPQNILLDDKFVAKLSDFGLSKQLDRARSRTMTSMRGTPGYLAPEWLLQTAVSDKSDVYSFGMVLLELVSGRRNVDYSGLNPDQWFWPAWVVNKAVSGLWPDIRTELLSRGWPLLILNEGEKAIKVALWCLQEDPKSRPTMSTVLLMLEGLVHVADPPLNMRLTLETQARLLASLHPDHCSSPQISPSAPLLLTGCFSNVPWSFATGTRIPSSAPLHMSSPHMPCLKQSLSI